YASYDFTEDLKFTTRVSSQFQHRKRSRYQGLLSHRAGVTQLDIDNQSKITVTTDNFLSYNKSIDKHDFGAVIGMNSEQSKIEFSTARGTGYQFDYVQTLDAATVLASAASYQLEESLLSYFGRVNYAYDGKYLASVSYRRDGSSRFGEDVKFGNFTAFSLGWRISEEEFMENNELFSSLKARFSYGLTGNNNLDTRALMVDYYPSLALLSPSTATTEGGGTGTGFNPLNIANPNLQWERSVEFNPGIDFGIFGGAISGSIDYYNRTSDQLLLSNPVSYTTGFAEALVNIGTVENKGYEVELRSKNITKDNFKWSTTLLASMNKNNLVDFAESDGQIKNVDSKRAAEWINSVGNPISSFYGWVVDKDIPLEYLSNPFHPIGAEAQDVYVKDLNGDGIIDDEDKAILGNPYPDLVWSITNDFKFGNIDLNFIFQGSHGAEVRNMGDQYLFNQFNSGQDFISSTPNQEFIKQKIFTNDIIQDASYIALRTINLGYNIPQKLVSKYGLSKMRIYATGQNLIYITADDYTGYNPESIYETDATTFGYQRAGSPIQKTVSVGLNLEF
ncbi:SusC/RagA family TonB-linked outer membrane protein, partial [Bacteroidota bacterium]